MAHIYGKIDSKTDLERVFREIRKDVDDAKSRPAPPITWFDLEFFLLNQAKRRSSAAAGPRGRKQNQSSLV